VTAGCLPAFPSVKWQWLLYSPCWTQAVLLLLAVLVFAVLPVLQPPTA
jgi:hypothetical protein